MINKNKILNNIEKDLLETEEFYIPIKKIWLWLKEEYKNPPALAELTTWLKADKRFKVHWIKERDEDDIDLEEVGFFSGPRVGLSRRQPTREDMARIIAKHADNMAKFLEKANETRPDDLSEEDKKTLDEAMKRAKAMKDKIRDIFNA